MHPILFPAFIVLSLAACGDVAKLSVSAGTGTKPELPEPRSSLIPTVHIAPAVGWAEDATPIPAEGTIVNAFAKHLDHPRWLYQLPNGDILVAETNAPPEGGRFQPTQLGCLQGHGAGWCGHSERKPHYLAA